MMDLSAADIVRVWELGQGRPLWYRALLMLSPAFPDIQHAELATLSLGQRNICLFQLRQRLVGPVMNAKVGCPQCGEILEFAIAIQDICPQQPKPTAAQYRLEAEGFEVFFRLLDSRDLEMAARHSDVASARAYLLSRCILQVREGEQQVEIANLPASLIHHLGDHLLERDPLAEFWLSLNCPACNHQWSAHFDIATFLWSEVSIRAQRVLEEIHTLAKTYSWHEADILAMTSARRQYYLDKATE